MNGSNKYSIINILIFTILLNFALCETFTAENKTGTCKNIDDCTGKYKPVLVNAKVRRIFNAALKETLYLKMIKR